ncbi:exodeoxyribonuclease-like [Symsagittifera roscoffensis]|uniref:exodeoxyribonuclease-like n=1 Tax=Symsagittifera roscoffensis TaxID=84072 RepID=UPI00307C8403
MPPAAKKMKREEIPSLDSVSFECSQVNKEGKKHNLVLASWNINGIRAWAEKKAWKYILKESPDVICFQETKCSDKDVPPECNLPGYYSYYNCGTKPGYSGTGLLTKKKPKKVTMGIGKEQHDDEGRVITAEFDEFFFVGAYVPNSGRGLVRLKYRTQEFDKDFREYLMVLDKQKPVIYCGDLNVAHEEIDLKNPTSNRNKTAGFHDDEREQFTELLSSGFVDTFRKLYPAEQKFSYWSYMGNARGKNVGWRLDYFVVSERIFDKVNDSVIRAEVHGSDHCPVVLFLNL